MDEFEILDSSGATPHAEPTDHSGGTSMWLLAVPVLAVIALVVVLSQGGRAPESQGTSPTTTEVPSDASPTTTSLDGVTGAPSTTIEGARSLGDEATAQLLASFDDRVVIGSGPGGVLQAQRVSESEARSLGVSGRPLTMADDWLILSREPGLWALDLGDGSGAEVQLGVDGIAIEYAESADGMLWVAGFDRETNDFRTLGFVVGAWETPTVVVDQPYDDGLGGIVFRSPWGSGAYELTPTGYERRGDGQVISYTDELVLVEECEVDPLACAMVLRDRATWNQRAAIKDQLGYSVGSVTISQDGPVAYVTDPVSSPMRSIVDLLTGSSVPLPDDNVMWWAGSQVASNDLGVLISWIDSVGPGTPTAATVVVDRATGAEVPVDVASGLVVRADLPGLEAAGG